MKLTEAIQFRQPLFESFKDLKGIIEKDIANEINEMVGAYFEGACRDFQEAMGEYSEGVDLDDAKDIVDKIREILQHPLSETDLDMLMRFSKDYGNDDRTTAIMRIAANEAKDIIEKLNEPERQDPDYDIIGQGQDYIIYQLNNYSSARKMCNAFGTSHCIGSSDSDMFDTYGRHEDRETFAIATSTKRLVIVHSGGTGFLITSHDNNNEVSNNDSRGSGMGAVLDDLIPPLDFDTVRGIFTEILDDNYIGDLQNIIDTYQYDLDEDTGRIIEKLGRMGDSDLSIRQKGNVTYLHIFTPRTDISSSTDYTAKDGKIYEIVNRSAKPQSRPAAKIARELDEDPRGLKRLIRALQMTGNEVAEEIGEVLRNDIS